MLFTKLTRASIVITFLLTVVMAFSPVALAASPTVSTNVAAAISKGAACEGLNQLDAKACEEGGSGVKRVFSTITDVLSLIVGAVAVIMIIVSAYKFMTASGDSGKIASARNTLVYALIGVAIVALAQLLVNVVFKLSK